MKKMLFSIFILSSINFYSQEKGNFFGGLESNSQWYLNDSGLKDDFKVPLHHPEDPIRSNSYLFLNYKYKNWSAGIQGESYEEQALQNYNPGYKHTNVGTYYLQFKTSMIDITAGYFYEQFGSGLLFRSWEDRALGINNALRGGRVIFKPTNYLTLKSIYGQQRSGFDVSDAKIYGTDLDIVLSNIFKFNVTELSLGLSYIGRDEAIKDIENPTFSRLTNGYAGRINFSHNSFYASSEFDYKSNDAVSQIKQIIDPKLSKPGNALLFNLGYSKKGFGIDGTFRRLENMSFYSERAANGNAYNDKIMNFVPSLTKQQHYNLANIYVYQAQPGVSLIPSNVKAGEIGGQIDLFYNFKKGTSLGGKHGTKIALNVSNWNNLAGDYYISNPQDYKTDFFAFGKKYFTEYNFEVTKKWNEKWNTGFSYINQYSNGKLTGSGYIVKSNIVAAEATYKFTASKSIRMVGEHLWADEDKKNWAASTVEYNLNSIWSVYVTDMYNYGNPDDELKTHYYNVGGAFRKKSTRIALNYGRQRGGLVCVGGVCRYVDPSNGVSLSLNTTF